MEKNIKNKEIQFIVYITYEDNVSFANIITNNYDLIEKDAYNYEDKHLYAHLFKLKEE